MHLVDLFVLLTRYFPSPTASPIRTATSLPVKEFWRSQQRNYGHTVANTTPLFLSTTFLPKSSTRSSGSMQTRGIAGITIQIYSHYGRFPLSGSRRSIFFRVSGHQLPSWTSRPFDRYPTETYSNSSSSYHKPLPWTSPSRFVTSVGSERPLGRYPDMPGDGSLSTQNLGTRTTSDGSYLSQPRTFKGFASDHRTRSHLKSHFSQG